MLQLFVEKFNDYGNHLNFFWSYFNEMLKFVRDGKSKLEQISEKKKIDFTENFPNYFLLQLNQQIHMIQ